MAIIYIKYMSCVFSFYLLTFIILPIGESVAKQLQAMFTLVIGLVIGFTASWKIAFVVLATFPLNIIAGGIQMQAVSGQQ